MERTQKARSLSSPGIPITWGRRSLFNYEFGRKGANGIALLDNQKSIDPLRVVGFLRKKQTGSREQQPARPGEESPGGDPLLAISARDKIGALISV